MKRALVILAAATLSGCLAVPASTIVRMATLDPMTMDPAQIRAAVRLPETIDIPAGKAQLTLAITLAGMANAEPRSFALTEDAGSVAAPGLADQAKPGYRLSVYRLTAADAAALTAYRQEIAERAKASTGKNAMTLSVAADACRASGKAGDPALFTTYFATDAAAGFIVLTGETDLAALVRQQDGDLPPCPASPALPRG